MIDGRTIRQITKVMQYDTKEGVRRSIIIEVVHTNCVFKAYLPKGKLKKPHGYRKNDLIQFFADPGGLRTVNADDIIL